MMFWGCLDDALDDVSDVFGNICSRTKKKDRRTRTIECAAQNRDSIRVVHLIPLDSLRMGHSVCSVTIISLYYFVYQSIYIYIYSYTVCSDKQAALSCPRFST